MKNFHIVLRYVGLPPFACQGDQKFSNQLNVWCKAVAETASKSFLKNRCILLPPCVRAPVRGELLITPACLLALSFQHFFSRYPSRWLFPTLCIGKPSYLPFFEWIPANNWRGITGGRRRIGVGDTLFKVIPDRSYRESSLPCFRGGFSQATGQDNEREMRVFLRFFRFKPNNMQD